MKIYRLNWNGYDYPLLFAAKTGVQAKKDFDTYIGVKTKFKPKVVLKS